MENNTKCKKFQLDLIPTLSRATMFSGFIYGKPLNFAVKYDKKSTALQFQFDSNSSLIRSGKVKIQMYRNLEICNFSKMFFNLETAKDNYNDYRSKFIGVKPLYSKQLVQFMKEKYDLQVNEKGKPSQNYLMVMGWKIQDIDNDLLFYFVQRKCYNDITRVNVIRTAGLQMFTERGSELFNRYLSNCDTIIRKAESYDNIPLPCSSNMDNLENTGFFEEDDTEEF